MEFCNTLLAHQADMLRRYQEEAMNVSDVALELPTGSGKTLVGLLIGEYRRRFKGERVVYLCPTRQLVNQVVEQSRVKYGIKTNAFIGKVKHYAPTSKSEYNNGEAIAVTNYSSLFNTNPFFYNPNFIVLDDAHSAENYIASFWSLTIQRKDYPDLYRVLVEVVKDDIPSTQYQRLISKSPLPSDFQWIDKVPTVRLLEILPNLTALLDVNTEKNDLQYAWSVIRDHLQACHLYLSWNTILIRPVIPPSLTHPPFANATQRLYMSATLGAGGDLERITGISKIHRLPIPKGWDKQGFGRKLFFFPEVSLSEEDALSLVLEKTKHTPRTLVLVPDDKSVDELKSKVQSDTSYKIFNASDIENSKLEFTKTDKAVAILANRFDGIDMFGDECRLLIVKGLPRATNLQEKFLESRMAASILLQDRIRTRTVQAVGRCTRSATDYSAVCVLGQELIDVLIQKQNRELFHPELQGELTFGYEESKKAKSEDFLDNLDIFLSHGDEWDQVDSEIVARRDASTQVPIPSAEKLLKAAEHEVKYQYAMWSENYEGAILEIDQVFQHLNGDDVKGYRGFWYYLAGSAAWLEYKKGNEAFAEIARSRFNQAAACTLSITWFRGLIQFDSTAKVELSSDQYLAYVIEGLETTLAKQGTSSNRNFEKEASFIIDNIKSQEAKKFEEAHMRLGKLLGYTADNSEETAAPDPWWIVSDDLCIVAEDKSDGGTDTSVSVSKTRQAASHHNWIRRNLKLANDAIIITVMITTAKTIDNASIPYAQDVLYWYIDDFREWAFTAINIVRKLRASFSNPGDIFWRNQAMQEYKDAKIDPHSLITFLKGQPLKDLPTPKKSV